MELLLMLYAILLDIKRYMYHPDAFKKYARNQIFQVHVV